MKKKIRYAVVGIGHIAQVAILPAFKNNPHAELTALVSGDAKKLKELGKRYRVENLYSYDEYDACLASGEIDAVYIALPNSMHREYAVRAAEAGIHVLLEKPIAVTSHDGLMIARAAEKAKVKLMIAYRLHFDPSNLDAIKLVHSGKIGEPRYFTSEFGYELNDENIRMSTKEGGSPLHDIGVYCINATRYLFKADPTEVFAFSSTPDARFQGKIKETVTAMLKFPDGELASFTCSFGSGGISNYRVVGTKGNLYIDNAYEYVGAMKHTLTIGEKIKKWITKPGDQFAAEISYFTNCILHNRQPEPAGTEGIVDVKIVEALLTTLKTGKPVSLKLPKVTRRPSQAQKIKMKAHGEPKLVDVEQPSR
jgi:predicted dehydrogenase